MRAQWTRATARIHDWTTAQGSSTRLCLPFSPLLTTILHREFWAHPGSLRFAVSSLSLPFLYTLHRVLSSLPPPLIAPTLWKWHWPFVSISLRRLGSILFNTTWRRAGTSPLKILPLSSNTTPTRMQIHKAGLASSVKETRSSTAWQSALERVSMSPLVKQWPKSFSTVSPVGVANLNRLTNTLGRHRNLPQWCNYGKDAIQRRARWPGLCWATQRWGLD